MIETNNKLKGKINSSSSIKGSGISVKGETGNGIEKIEKTNTEGLIDTYTIYYTNGTTSTFQVSNGEKGDKGDKGNKGDTGEVSQEELKKATENKRLKLGGKSEQETRSGKNKFNVADINSIQSIVSVENSSFNLTNCWANTMMTKENVSKYFKVNTNYIFTAKVTLLEKPTTLSSSNHDSILNLYNGSSNVKILYSTNKSDWKVNETRELKCPFTTPADLTNYIILGYNYHGNNDASTSYSPLGKFKIEYCMIREATELDDTFEQYGAAPTSEFSAEIRNIGNNINLFDGELETGSINSSGINTTSTKCIRTQNYQKVESNKDYIISNDKNYNCILYFYNSSKSFIASVGGTTSGTQKITTPANTEYIKWRTSEGSSQNELTTRFKLQKGKISTSYTEYGCGSIDYEIKNKNFIDYNKQIVHSAITSKVIDDELIIERNTEGKGCYVYFEIQGLKIGKEYTIKCNSKITIYKDKIYGSTYSSTTNASKGHSFKALQEKYIVAIIIGSEDIPNTGDILNCGKVQLEEGSITTDYVKHQEQTIHFPLSKGQVIHKDDYINNTGIHQKRKTVRLTDIIWEIVNSRTNTILFRGAILQDILNIGDIVGLDILSNYFSSGDVYNKDIEGIEHIGKRIFVSIPKIILTTQDATGLKKYLNDNDVVCEYPLAEEIVTPLTQKQIDAFYELQKAKYVNEMTLTCLNEIEPTLVDIDKSLEESFLENEKAITEIKESKSIISATITRTETNLSTYKVTTTDLIDLTLNNPIIIGQKLKLDNGNIVIGDNVKHIKVSAQVYFFNVLTAGKKSFQCLKNGETAVQSSQNVDVAYSGFGFSENVLEVNKGDVISLGLKASVNDTIYCNRNSTWITVEVID